MVLEGRGVLARLPEMMAALRLQKPLLVGNPVMAARLPVDGVVFHDYHANPDFADCVAGARLARCHGCDGVISIGGGSAMDTAKCVKALLLAHSEKDVLESRLPQAAPPFPHIAVPTTAGTGAEVTAVAVVYVDKTKVSVTHEALVPNGVVLDAALLDTLPALHRKACALDALCQGVESWWAVAATAESRRHAEAAVRGVLRNLDAYLAGDWQAEEAMLHGAYESGLAIRRTKTTAAHAMSYRITQLWGVPHGYACMLTLPHLWRRLVAEQPHALDGLAAVMGLRDASEGAAYLQALLCRLHMPQLPMPSQAQLDELAGAVDGSRLGNHPQRLTQQDLRAIYEEALRPCDLF